MKGIQNMENGRRIILIGEWIPFPGQKRDTALDVLEHAYIEHSLSAGYELLNKQGTRTPINSIVAEGKKKFLGPFPRKMNVKKSK